MGLDLEMLRAEFPLLRRKLDGMPMLYLDCASTAPRCAAAIAAVRKFMEHDTANVHRGVHWLATEASAAFEAARHCVARHLGAVQSEIVFTSGTTQAINLVASGLGLHPDDEVLLTGAEHHANLLPWRERCRVVVLPSRADGVPCWNELERHVTARTRLIATHHASNVLGTLAPLAVIAAVAARHKIPWLVDGAQAAGHVRVDVRELDCTYYAFSAHKLGGPAGTGALYAQAEALAALQPSQHGGGMVAKVGAWGQELRLGPARFEAGTPNVEGVLGMAAALEFLRSVGMDAIAEHGKRLAACLLECARGLPGVRVLGADGPAEPRIPLVSLALPEDGLDAESVARTLSDSSGILVSAGRHCAHPLHDAIGAKSTLRAAAWIVHDEDDIARLGQALRALLS